MSVLAAQAEMMREQQTTCPNYTQSLLLKSFLLLQLLTKLNVEPMHACLESIGVASRQGKYKDSSP